MQDDPIEWARAETWRYTARRLKRYALLASVMALVVIMLLKGMPLHFLWPILGVPSVIAFAAVVAPTLYYTAMTVGEWMDKRDICASHKSRND